MEPISGKQASTSPIAPADAHPAPPKRQRSTEATASAAGLLAGLPRRPAFHGTAAENRGDADVAGGCERPLRERRHDLLTALIASSSTSVAEQRLPLAGYLLARTIDRRPVSGKGIAALRTADDAVNDVRAALPHGRGNVDTDITRTNGESVVLTLAARRAAEDLLETATPMIDGGDVDSCIADAAASRMYGAGNCGVRASIGVLAYGARALQAGRRPDESVHIVAHENEDEDHEWAEVRPSDPDLGPVVLDAWCDGSAVFAEDSRFARERNSIETSEVFDVATAAEGHWFVESLAKERETVDEDVEQRLSEARAYVMGDDSDDDWREGIGRPAQSVLDDAFASRVRRHFYSEGAGAWGTLLAEVQATGVSMSLGTRRVVDRVRDASRIIEVAKTLVAPQDSAADLDR
jgi:hypothetical protein